MPFHMLGMGILGERVETLGFYGMAVIFAGLILIDGRLEHRAITLQRTVLL